MQIRCDAGPLSVLDDALGARRERWDLKWALEEQSTKREGLQKVSGNQPNRLQPES